jgi:hypothetical protein
MYRRQECLIHASMCREKAQAYPARSDHWIDRAITWHQRAVQTRHENAVTHEVHSARLIAQASKRSQVIVVSHAPVLVSALDAEADSRQIVLEKQLGEIIVRDGTPPDWTWPAR